MFIQNEVFFYANEENIRWDFERESPLPKACHKTSDAIPLHILDKLHILMQQKYCLSNTKTAYD